MQHGVHVAHPDKVKQQLFLSSLRSEACPGVLDSHGITHILQVGFELRPSHPSRYTYLSLPVYDMVEQDIIGCFPLAFEFIDKAIASGGTVLVHCQAGISRSASVVIGYCMWKDEMSVEAATAAVQRARPSVWPNAGFKCQLRAFEAMGCDASRWQGWSMQQYLHTQYGDDSVGFMSSMLGGAPVDRLRDGGPNARRAAAAAAASKESPVFGAAHSTSRGGASLRAAADIGGGRESGSDSSARQRRGSWSYSNSPYMAAAAAAAGVAVLSSSSLGRQRTRSDVGEEAALMMAG